MSEIKVFIGADIVPSRTNYDLFSNNNVEALCGNGLMQLMQTADYRILNLETPLTDLSSPISKAGPCFMAPVDTVKGIKGLGIDFLTLANNHIMDQGEPGLKSTINALKEYGIAYSGAGDDLQTAIKPYIAQIKDKKVGIYCCAEHEFSIATNRKAGANPFDPLESSDHISELKAKCDFVICLYHGGKEHYRYPSPNLRKNCRKIVEKGADLVVCQHSHCVGCEEHYRGGVIVYGQGNFLVDHSKSEYRHTALLIELNISEDGFSVNYHPLNREEHGIRLSNEHTGARIIDDFNTRSKEISVEGFTEKAYSKYCNENMDILLSLAGKKTSTVFFKALNKLSRGSYARWYIKRVYREQEKLVLINRIECETWRELILTALK